MRQQGAHPAEFPSYIAGALELGVSLSGERARQENRKEKQDDSADLARERRARGRAIAPVPARAS